VAVNRSRLPASSDRSMSDEEGREWFIKNGNFFIE
jgi:hypothetical protein